MALPELPVYLYLHFKKMYTNCSNAKRAACTHRTDRPVSECSLYANPITVKHVNHFGSKQKQRHEKIARLVSVFFALLFSSIFFRPTTEGAWVWLGVYRCVLVLVRQLSTCKCKSDDVCDLPEEITFVVVVVVVAATVIILVYFFSFIFPTHLNLFHWQIFAIGYNSMEKIKNKNAKHTGQLTQRSAIIHTIHIISNKKKLGSSTCV